MTRFDDRRYGPVESRPFGLVHKAALLHSQVMQRKIFPQHDGHNPQPADSEILEFFYFAFRWPAVEFLVSDSRARFLEGSRALPDFTPREVFMALRRWRTYDETETDEEVLSGFVELFRRTMAIGSTIRIESPTPPEGLVAHFGRKWTPPEGHELN